MSSYRFRLDFALGAVLLLLMSAVCTSVRAQVPSGTVSRPEDPLSRDPRRPNTYDLEHELRNARVGKEVEIALQEAGAAFNARPPRYVEAEAAYLRAAKLEPKEARAYLGLGLVYAAQNEVDKTIAAFKRSIEVKPKYAEAHFNLGMVYLAIAKKNEAIKAYESLKPLDKELAKKLKELIEK